MGGCCGGYEDQQVDSCFDIEQLIDLLKERQIPYVEEKDKLEKYLSSPNPKPISGISPFALPDELQEKKIRYENISNEYSRAINLVEKYKSKLKVDKVKKEVKNLCKCSLDDPLSMKYQINEFEKYCCKL